MLVLILDGLILTLDIIKYKNRYLMLIVMPKNVSEIMTVKIETIRLEDTAQVAARKMKEKNVSSLVVMDGNDQAVGIVTERDLVTQVCCREASSNEYIIRHIMSSPVATIDPDSTVETAASLMQQNKVKHLVVVDENKTVGIITSSNLIKYLDGQLELDDVNAKILATAFSEEPM
jgi:signal-transduction protein with cAMP-binding, CBS, and nucleotidyltransferase domain